MTAWWQKQCRAFQRFTLPWYRVAAGIEKPLPTHRASPARPEVPWVTLPQRASEAAYLLSPLTFHRVLKVICCRQQSPDGELESLCHHGNFPIERHTGSSWEWELVLGEAAQIRGLSVAVMIVIQLASKEITFSDFSSRWLSNSLEASHLSTLSGWGFWSQYADLGRKYVGSRMQFTAVTEDTHPGEGKHLDYWSITQYISGPS